jgi:hypothetical protein
MHKNFYSTVNCCNSLGKDRISHKGQTNVWDWTEVIFMRRIVASEIPSYATWILDQSKKEGRQNLGSRNQGLRFKQQWWRFTHLNTEYLEPNPRTKWLKRPRQESRQLKITVSHSWQKTIKPWKDMEEP